MAGTTNKQGKQKEAPEVDENDSEDELLAQAAAQWGASKQDTAATTTPPKQQAYSLHVTQLSFDATDYTIRTAFVQKGCSVTSVRLVYDYDQRSNTKTFRGVAFVDVADKDSFQKALTLDRSTLLGRRINVRPTKSKSELANIVERTRNLVAQKIRREREDEEKRKSSNDGSKEKHTDKKRRHNDSKERHDHKKRKYSSDANDDKPNAQHAKKHKSPSNQQGEKRKLTKKERNRRAAIIMSRKRGKR